MGLRKVMAFLLKSHMAVGPVLTILVHHTIASGVKARQLLSRHSF